MAKQIEAADGKGETKVEDLIAKMEAQQKQIERLQEQNIALISQPSGGHHSAPAQPQLPAEPELNLDGLPDQLTDGAKYNTELAKRIKAYNAEMRGYEAQVKKASAAAADTTPRVNEAQLWELYQEDHPAYAKSEAKVRAAAGIAIERMQKRGVDAMALMQRSPEDFFRKINEVYVKEFGDPLKAAGKGDDGSDGDGKGNDDDDGGRTAGLFGGQDSGGKPTKGKGEDKGESMSKQLADLQNSLWAKPGA